MAKSILSTLLTGALKIAAEKNKTAKQASSKTQGTSTFKPTVGSASAAVKSTQAVKSTSNLTGIIPKNVETIKFGPYEWQVLERKGNTVLIITVGIIEKGPYHTEKMSQSDDAPFIGATWENSDLRKNLNGKFLEKFSSDDIARIIEVTNQNPDNPWFTAPTAVISAPGAMVRNPKGGNPTKDKVFLLSIEEACRYFGDSTARLKNKGFTQYGSGGATKLSMEPGTSFGDTTRISDQNDKNRIAIIPKNLSIKGKEDSPFKWWLRSPGEADILAAEVSANGRIQMTGSKIYATRVTDFGGIRPVLWLKM